MSLRSLLQHLCVLEQQYHPLVHRFVWQKHQGVYEVDGQRLNEDEFHQWCDRQPTHHQIHITVWVRPQTY